MLLGAGHQLRGGRGVQNGRGVREVLPIHPLKGGRKMFTLS